MRRIKTLSGTGNLNADGEDLGQANYEINVYQVNRSQMTGEGHLIAADIGMALSALEASELVLTRQDTGKPVRIIVTSFGSSEVVPIKLAGGDLGD